MGSQATFSATVGGTAPISYQWQFNNVNLTNGVGFYGVTNSTLIISNVSGAYVGTYDLVVSNLFGAAVTSSNATLGILAPAVVGQWLNGTTNLNDTSGYSPTNTHDLYTVGVGNFMFTNDVPPNQPTNGVSMWLYNGDTGLSVSNSSTLDASYTNTFDNPIQANFSFSLWARGFPGGWNPWVSKYGENAPESGWQLREDGSTGESYACLTCRNGGIGTLSLGRTVYGNSDDMASGVPSNDGQWHNYVGTLNGITGERDLYVDGYLVAQEQGSVAYTLAAAEHLVIGGKDSPPGNTFGNYFTGELYNVQIFNYALTQSNIIAAIGPLPPTIEIQPPTNVTAYATFQTQISPGGVLGSLPLSYQWQLNGTNISDDANFIGTASNILTINVNTTLAGVYDVVVTNLYRRITVSSNSILTVVPASLLGEWFTNNTLTDVSGYSPAGTHDGYAVGNTGYVFTNDVPAYHSGQGAVPECRQHGHQHHQLVHLRQQLHEHV